MNPGEQKKARLASEIERAMQDVLARGLSDPRIRGLITVTGVDLSDDRRRATVRVSVLPREHESLTMHGLRAATSHIRQEAMRRVRSRMFPGVQFRLDEAFKESQDVLSLISKATSESHPETDRDDAGERAKDHRSGNEPPAGA